MAGRVELELGADYELVFRLAGERTDKRARMQLVGLDTETGRALWNCRPAFGHVQLDLDKIKGGALVESVPRERYFGRRA